MTKRSIDICKDIHGHILDSNTTVAVYDNRNRILAVAQNSFIKTHPKQARFAKQANLPKACYLHAEVLAIIRALKHGIPYKIKIERYFKNGMPALAKPCPICELAIKEAGIHYVEYTI